MKLSMSLLPFESNELDIESYNNNSNIDEVIVSCIKSNDKVMKLTDKISKGVATITLNKIKNEEDLKKTIDDISNKYNIKEVLLLNGSPAFGGSPKFSSLEVIPELTNKNILVNVGGYVENFVWKRTQKDHFEEQARILKKKQEAGASKVFTQGFVHFKNVEPFIKTLREKNVEMPLRLGIIPPSFSKSTQLMLAKKNYIFNSIEIDFPLRVAISSLQNVEQKTKEIVDLNILNNEDGIYLSSPVNVSRYIDRIKKIIG